MLFEKKSFLFEQFGDRILHSNRSKYFKIGFFARELARFGEEFEHFSRATLSQRVNQKAVVFFSFDYSPMK